LKTGNPNFFSFSGKSWAWHISFTSAPLHPRKTMIGWKRRSTNLKLAGGQEADSLIAEIDKRYLRASGHAKPHRAGDLGHE
jgi:hypothetical protein